MPDMVRRCGWCEAVNTTEGPSCVKCGGPLPIPPGHDPGEPPPDPPRPLPGRYWRHKLFFGNFAVWFGGIWAAIGGLLAVVFLVLTVVLPPLFFGACFGSLFFIVGVVVAGVGIRNALRRMSALRRGVAAPGEIVRVSENSMDTANGQHPWLIEYTFDLGGSLHGGSISSWDPVNAHREPGQKVTIVYLPDDPDVSEIWPPVK